MIPHLVGWPTESGQARPVKPTLNEATTHRSALLEPLYALDRWI